MRRTILLALLLIGLAAKSRAQSHPVFFDDADLVTARAQMKTDYEANPSAPSTLGGKLYKFIKDTADSGARYGDAGQFGAWMYHVTGDTGYVTKAWTQLTSGTHAGGNFINRPTTCNYMVGDYAREYFWQQAWMYDWLYPGLDASQRTSYLAQLNAMAACVDTGSYLFRPEDTDQTTGTYFGLAMLYVATTSYNAAVNTVWNDVARHVGGLDDTAADRTTYRNAVKLLVTGLGADGGWMESSEYNTSTVKIFINASEAIRSATGVDHFPEITTYKEKLAEQVPHNYSPGLSAASQVSKWGDNENPRTFTTWTHAEYWMVVAGANRSNSAGAKLNDMLQDVFDGSAVNTIMSQAYARGFILFNPYATRTDYTTVPLNHYATGIGLANVRTGWTASDTWFIAHTPPAGTLAADQWPVDHFPQYFGAFQLWRNGAWAITHPQCYAGPCGDPRGSNGLSLGGLGLVSTIGFKEYKQPRAYKRETTDADFAYLVGTEGGSWTYDGDWSMPANFLMEHTRSLVYLPGLDVVAVHDRANAKDHVAVASTRYSTIGTWQASRPRKELYIATTVSPTIESGYIDWAYSGANHTRVTMLLPASASTTIEDESTLWTTGYFQLGTVNASEKKFHVRIVPTVTQQWDTFLNVWDAYGTATPATVTLVQDATGLADAAIITKGSTSYLLAFNAIQGVDIAERTGGGGNRGYWSGQAATVLDTVRLRKSSLHLAFTAANSMTKAVVFDLDPNTSWTYAIDGGSSSTLTVSDKGIGIIAIAGTGAKTLDVQSAGDMPVQINDASLPNGRKGAAYSYQMHSSGGAGSPVWSKTVGTWQTGISISSGGLISGTPTAAGAQTVTLQACDPSPTNCVTREYTLTVADVPSITTASLADCALGSAYSQTLAAAGGTAPYTFSVQSGTLPTGLSLAGASGAITGTCTGALGLSALTFRVTDAVAGTGDTVLSITVVPELPSMTVVVVPGSTSAVVTFGITGLPYQDSCAVDLKSGSTTEETKTASTGASRRSVTFTGLVPLTTYGIDVTCDTAVTQQRAYFTTKAPAAGSTNQTFKIRAPAWVKARATAQYGSTANLGLVVCFDATCATTYSCKMLSDCPGDLCTVTRSLTAGIWPVWHRWSILPTGADVCAETLTYATTTHRKGYIAVP